MKIVHVIDNLGQGGAQRITLGIVDELDCPLIVLNEREEEINTFPGIECIKLGSANKYSLQGIVKFLKYVSDNEIEIIHTHLFKSFFSGILVKFYRRNQIKLIVHEHGQVLSNKKSFTNLLYKILLRLSNLFDIQFLTVSNYAKDHLTKFVKKGRIKVLNNFIDNKYFDNSEKIVKDLTGGIIVGYAGRLNKHKGLLEFLKGMSLLVQDYSQVKVLIAGDGEIRDSLPTLLKDYKLEESVTYLGLVQDMVSFYEKLTIFVNPSHYESMGLTHIEAMAMGVPVVVSDVPAMNTMLTDGKNCCFFEKGNAEDLANKVKLLIRNEEIRKEFSEEGQRFAENFRKKSYMKDLNNIYIELKK